MLKPDMLKNVFNTGKLFVLACGLACVASAAQAYTPKWLACGGNLTITPTAGQATQQTASDTFVYDDDAHNLFKYSPQRKALDIVGVTSYTDHDIKWEGRTANITHSEWAGTLDRNSLALRLNYKDSDGTEVWSESCKPTAPLTP